MTKFVTLCPSCQERLSVTRLGCARCDLKLEGQFEIPRLLGLPSADLDFVVKFVTASGSLKEMARIQGQSYPTIRARLDEIIEKLCPDEARHELGRNEILDAIAAGKMTAAEGAAALEELKR